MNKADNHRINIAFILPSLEMGGSERVALTIIKSLPTYLFDLQLIVIGSKKGVLVKEIPPYIKVVFIDARHLKYTIFTLLGLIWRSKPDVIFAGMSYVGLYCSFFRAFFPRNSILVTRETNCVSLNNRSYKWPGWWNFFYKRFYRRSDFIICQTQEMQRDLVNNFAIDEKKTTVIGNPIDIKKIRKLSAENYSITYFPRKKPKTTRFVFVGRLRKEKNLDLMLDAFRTLQFHNTELLIVGSGPEENRLKSKCVSSGIEDNVKFLGFLENPYPIMSSADALLLTSKHEGLPNAVLEAICLNIPVISTSAGGQLSAVLSKVPGCFLSEAETVESFANAIREWMDSHASLKNDYVITNFNKEKILKLYSDLFLRLASRK